MKNYIVILLIVVCPFLPAQANIFNGYYADKHNLELNIETCKYLLENAETRTKRRKIEKDLKHMQKEYSTVVRKFMDTQEVIDMVRQIDPGLYEAVSNVVNAKGTLTHVHVRCSYSTDSEFAYFADNYFDALAYTSVSPAPNDIDACFSQSGLNTITITIGCRNDMTKALALAHEFGHVLFVVPNLRSYTKFMKKNSNRSYLERRLPGHHPLDPSRQTVKSAEGKFRENYMNYMNTRKGDKE